MINSAYNIAGIAGAGLLARRELVSRASDQGMILPTFRKHRS